MGIVRDFKPIDDLDGYDKAANPKRLSVVDLLPYSVSWLCDGNIHKIKHHDKIIPLLLMGGAGIALIKSPFKSDDNNAYIISPSNEIKWDVGNIVRHGERMIMFSDVYYIADELYFFVNINGSDYRFSFEPTTGKVGRFIQSY